ncbi:MAG: NifB/NifX family molybdenum-iron cluster-binding protein [Desulfovibrionaceae bacterium]
MACGVNLLVCGALCGGARRTLESSGVILAPWLRGEVSEVLDAYQGDRLDALSMPGCRNRMGQRGECTPPGPRCRGALAGMAAPEKKTDGGNMKIAISSEGPGLESKLDPRFGRATGFVLYDPQTKAHEYVSNEQNLSLPQGAGIQAAQHVAGTGAGVVITGHMGPKAYLALERGNVQIYLGGEGTVAKAIEDYEAGRLEKAQGPDKQGHW